jgi:Cu-Zn family superoxide dismutase
MTIARYASAVAIFAGFALAACGGGTPLPETPATPETPAEPAPTPGAETPAAAAEGAEPAAKTDGPIDAQIQAKSGATLTGTAKFEDTPEGVKVSIRLGNAPPGLHGAHIHEKGDCSAADATSAGDHFNPAGHEHGRPPDEKRHLGDFGNIGVDASGLGVLEIVVKEANLKPGDKNSYLDRALIIHAKKDDGSQPSGNAGARIGCAEIKR